MRPDTIRFLTIIQLLSELGIAIGYALGLIPFVYIWSAQWIVPLTVLSLVLALLNRGGTFYVSLANVAFALLSYIPVLGYVFRIAGLAACVINARVLTRGREY
ncbi:hypothetical protein B5M42_014695 [Paenibacillus athensensis]|uniref:Uncharacterized protein n=1 Tax=Paenibacillus athensensis TaxID=1967502 RepID=A0A4Y8QAQ8_9BACL|nr:hypothetical protein [Paenibacillus athensensis]MCD1260060.1 hypothetical protein [Paenibacillus athensensis]